MYICTLNTTCSHQYPKVLDHRFILVFSLCILVTPFSFGKKPGSPY